MVIPADSAPSYEREDSSQDSHYQVPLDLEEANRPSHDDASFKLIPEEIHIKEDTPHIFNPQIEQMMSVSVGEQDLQAQLDNLRLDRERLLEENNRQKEDISVMNQKIEEAGRLNDENSRLNEYIAKLRSDFEIASTSAAKEAETKAKVEDLLVVCRREKESLIKDKEGLTSDLERIRDKFKVFRTAATSSLEQKGDLITMLKKALLDVDKNVERLKSTNTRVLAVNKKQIQQARTLTAEIHELKGKKQDLEADLAESEKRVQILESENKNTLNQLSHAHRNQQSVRNRLRQAQRNFDTQTEEYERARNELDKAEKELESLREDKRKLRRMLDNSQDKLEQTQADAEELKERFKRLQKTAVEWHNKNTVIQRELSDARNSKTEIAVELKRSRARNRSCEEKINDLESRLQDTEQKKRNLAERINDLESSLEFANQKKQDLQATEARHKREATSMDERLKALERQLYLAKRLIKSFDQMTSFQHEIRSTSDYDSIRRCKNYSPSSKSSKVIALVKRLNASIYRFAKHFVLKQNKHFFKTRPTPPNKRAKALLGAAVLSLLQGHSNKEEYSEVRLFLLAVFRMFLVTWCFGIIEGWYPKRQNFLDLLVKLNEEPSGRLHSNGRYLGKLIIL